MLVVKIGIYYIWWGAIIQCYIGAIEGSIYLFISKSWLTLLDIVNELQKNAFGVHIYDGSNKDTVKGELNQIQTSSGDDRQRDNTIN